MHRHKEGGGKVKRKVLVVREYYIEGKTETNINSNKKKAELNCPMMDSLIYYF